MIIKPISQQILLSSFVKGTCIPLQSIQLHRCIGTLDSTTKSVSQHDDTKTMASAIKEKANGSLMRPDSSKHHYYLSPTWSHPIFTRQQMESIKVEHREVETLSDKVAFKTMRFFRISFDFFTGYIHPPKGQESNPKYQMGHRKWLIRFIFLESIAGVPGMVGGMLRHLHSLRALRRDRGWMETLLEEAYNERMHLLTFIKLADPGLFMRTMLLGAQGVFFNLFFICYLASPKTCHRFVGYLEEEAIVTYTRCLEDIDNGLLKEWDNLEVPDIAREYWKMGENPTMRDLIMYVRADEAKHREVNHTLGNLDQKTDRNPFTLKIDNGKPQPSKDLSTQKGTGWERNDISL